MHSVSGGPSLMEADVGGEEVYTSFLPETLRSRCMDHWVGRERQLCDPPLLLTKSGGKGWLRLVELHAGGQSCLCPAVGQRLSLCR